MTDIAWGVDAPRPSRRRLSAGPSLIASVALVVVACSPAATAAPTGSPSGGPSAGPSAGPTGGPTDAPTTGAIAHPTGAGDVVLRVEETGGLMMVEHTMTYTPSFTLYGDGTVIWRDNFAVPAESSDDLIRPIPLLTAKLDEAAVQALLDEAIGRGGLGVASGPYNEMGGADIPSTIFTINAGDLAEPKRVEVVGLSPDMHPQDAQVVAALSALAEKLRTFDTLVAGQAYVPTSFRGVIMATDQAFTPVVDWPWTDVSPADFGGPNEFFKVHELTADQISLLGIKDFNSGVSGFVLQDGKDLYNFAIRPALPDELQAD